VWERGDFTAAGTGETVPYLGAYILPQGSGKDPEKEEVTAAMKLMIALVP
jgi:hypothetical protein